MRPIIKQVVFIFLIGLFLFSKNKAYAAGPPDWNVTGNYSLSQNMFLQLYVNDAPATGSGNIIGAFVNGEIRGVSGEIGAPSYFYMTAQSNSGLDELTFKVYIAADDQVYDIAETLVFNNIPTGIIALNTILTSDQPISLEPFLPETQIQGYPFQTINLPDSLIQYDEDEVVWTSSASGNLNVTITDSILNVIPYDSNWTGTDSITITATEQTPNAYAASQTIVYTVIPDYGPPDLGVVDDQTIGLNQSFEGFNLNDVLAPYPGDNLIFDYFMPQTTGTAIDQGWSVNSGNFQYNQTLIAKIHHGNSLQHASGSKLLAFIDGSLAGVAVPTPLGNEYLYFLNIYSNTNNKVVTFQFFDNQFDQLYPIHHTEIFQSNANIGTPGAPLWMNTAPLKAAIDANGNVVIGIEATGWVGQQEISFIAADGYQPTINFDVSSALFTVVNEYAPEVNNIPNQYVEIGTPFDAFDLNNYLTEYDNDPINWTATGANNLQVSSNPQNVIEVTPVDPNWIGEEVITFRATDQTGLGLYAEQAVIFAISQPNQAPEIANIPDQIIFQGGTFPKIDLDAYVNEPNGDEVVWSYYFPQTLSNNATQNWQIDPPSFSYQTNLIAKVKVRGIYPDATHHKLAAFNKNGLCGVASPTNSTGEWIYFLTIYSNESPDSIYFKYYDAEQTIIFAVDDSIKFISQQTIGSISNPFEMEAGFISVTEDEDILCPKIIDQQWTGTDTVYVIANELGTIDNYADTAQIIFRVNLDNTLPVDLVKFSGYASRRSAILNWEIDNPENVFGYEIEHARYAPNRGISQWDSIGFVAHFDQKNFYEFLHRKPNLSENYYRLRMVDFDGTNTFSPIIQIDFSNLEKEEISFFPNPTFGHSFHLELNTVASDLVTIKIVDRVGRNWTNIILYSDGNRQILPIDVAHYPPGIYFAKIRIGHQRIERSFMVAGD